MSANPSSEALRLENITKVYGNGILANDGINLTVNSGEIHAICGENGAGKSTLMKIIFGIESPSRGVVYVNGSKVDIKSPKDAIEKGFADEIMFSNDEDDIEDPLDFAASINSLPSRKAIDKFKNFMAKEKIKNQQEKPSLVEQKLKILKEN